jgi:cobalamin-dependent methionine synthase I
VAAVCTVGQAIDDVVSGAMDDDPLFGLALDGLGSAAVEALATSASNRFEAEAAAAGLETTIPLSPGMVGWPVERGQPELFALVRPDEAGVRLTSTWMMSPRKSISFVLGIGPDVRTSGRTCDYCSLKDTCRYQDHYAPQNAPA